MNEPPALYLVLSYLVTLFDFLTSEGIFLLPAEDEDSVNYDISNGLALDEECPAV